jgi:hypothetical protein
VDPLFIAGRLGKGADAILRNLDDLGADGGFQVS